MTTTPSRRPVVQQPSLFESKLAIEGRAKLVEAQPSQPRRVSNDQVPWTQQAGLKVRPIRLRDHQPVVRVSKVPVRRLPSLGGLPKVLPQAVAKSKAAKSKAAESKAAESKAAESNAGVKRAPRSAPQAVAAAASTVVMPRAAAEQSSGPLERFELGAVAFVMVCFFAAALIL